jgi:hypothetical protein
MKTIMSIACIVWFQCSLFSQTSDTQESLGADQAEIIYSEQDKSMIVKDSLPNKCTMILITELPPEDQKIAFLHVRFKKGTYVFKKDKNLEMPKGYEIYIEDTLTGQSFNMTEMESYAFSMNRYVPERFALCMKKTRLTAKAEK